MTSITGNVLLVGSTGLLGRQVRARLQKAGLRTRLTSRRPAELAERREGEDSEMVLADLKDPGSLRGACQGIEVVVSTATSTVSSQPGDSIETVDLRGQAALVEAAAAAGVKHFVYLSFPAQPEVFQLQNAKRAVEARLRDLLPHTILRPTFFTEVWLGPAVGFDVREHRLRVYGDGEGRVPWISVEDVAAAAVASAQRRPVGTFHLAGPAAVSPNQIISSLEKKSARSFAVERVPAAVLQAQYEGAEDPRQQAFFALALACARGVTIEAGARGDLPAPEIGVESYLSRTLGIDS
jgi:uncharacterized protein YbjT (DUF2867 family)